MGRNNAQVQGKRAQRHLEDQKGEYRATIVHTVGSAMPIVRTPMGDEKPLTAGDPLARGDRVESNGSYVELRGPDGEIYRLGPNSEFEWVPVPQVGFEPLYYGRVFIVTANGKYRTSCYIRKISSAYIENLNERDDAFYALYDDMLIFEYDEAGQYFDIVTVPRGHVAVLRHDPQKPMRSRYSVTSLQPFSDEELNRILNEFSKPSIWYNLS
ncbi:hypothetical protein ODE01S_17510 [Oceanithermus desulfurans NBRC 100063]|uniref:Uncharacterized protein n=2 Tax=Oceanithermus desulfurans TaxID=227924 RepID=A0A511RMJ5_9DEIN|nr:hypothetical protein ODE01S_17510 [Oceanithermus desulfurans NBRC 100063]